MRDADDSDVDDVENPSFDPSAWQAHVIEQALEPKGMPVADSDELTRVLALPRRPVVQADTATAAALVQLAQQKYSLGPRACKCRELDKDRPCLLCLLWVQAWALHEISTTGGLIASVPVGGGKCLDASTEVFDYRAGRRRRADEPGPLRVASFDGALGPRDATAFASGRKPCVEIAMREGTKITASTDHPILTARGWVHAAELQDSDYVAVAAEMPEPESPTQASDEEVAFVAYMLSDGGCSQSQMHFTNATSSVIEDWRRCAEAVGYNVAESASRSRARQFNLLRGRQRDSSTARYTHVPDPARERWDLHGLAKDKRAHADVWGLPRRQVALFLNRFWACDGHVSAKSLELTLASEHLIDDLRFLLLRLGIRSSKHYKRASYVQDGVRKSFDAWRIHISGAGAARFLDEIGDVLGKETACQALRDRLQATRRNTNYDVVPIGCAEIAEICDELGLPHHPGRRGYVRAAIAEHFHQTKGQHVSRRKFLEFCARWGYAGKYSHLATTDVAWERVRSVKDAGVRPVYDLSVPETHNFVANGVVVHNTVIGLLAPLALRNCRLALLLIPSSLKDQIVDDYKMLAEHFRVPGIVVHLSSSKTWRREARPSPSGGVEPTLHVLPYSRLSSIKSSDWIDRIEPDAIIADEVDALKDLTSARTLRVMRYMENHEATRFCGWTGSLTDSSVKEFAHLSALALRWGSPMPVRRREIDAWSQALDAVSNPCPPGALIRLLEPHETKDDVRRAFARRLAETPGFIMVGGRQVIVTSSGEPVEIDVRERPAPEIPKRIQEALDKARDFCRPDSMFGEGDDWVMFEKLEQARCVREIASGVMYRVTFPPIDGVPQRNETVREWQTLRREYHSEMRKQQLRGEEYLDSPKLLEHAAMRAWGDAPSDPRLPEWKARSYPAWRDIRGEVVPKHEAIRIDPYLVDDAAQWAVDSPGIVWCAMREFAEWLRERALELHGARINVYGQGSGSTILREDGSRSCIASIQSHGRGRNKLQYRYHRQLLGQSPASGRMMQQIFGRLHRLGQDPRARGAASSVVETFLYLHIKELRKTFDTALMKAAFAQDITNEAQRLLDGWDDGFTDF